MARPHRAARVASESRAPAPAYAPPLLAPTRPPPLVQPSSFLGLGHGRRSPRTPRSRWTSSSSLQTTTVLYFRVDVTKSLGRTHTLSRLVMTDEKPTKGRAYLKERTAQTPPPEPSLCLLLPFRPRRGRGPLTVGTL